MARRPVVPAVVVAVVVGMMVAVSEEMRSVYADLSKEVVGSRVWAEIVQGLVVVLGRVSRMYL